ncbi:ketoacyl-ACP synthase III [Weissella viridescens]|uniref:Beta-ketoacyl-[acyl-carrier-protein] synthase III n=1 Tax=Weissella viridescens TaxID=1629 RepID=A0A3P2REV2_WEIVI|nr:beta-ketoacyl-ACP synthase III [Weissella viridescens]RRG17965.1 ketoacyl-ACP synthase III [Weissella viridescens]
MEKFSILSTALAVPTNHITNDDLSQMMETSDEWIKSRTGIRQRHISQGQTTTDLAFAVAQKLLAKAHMAASELDFIIVATMSPDALAPTVSTQVQGLLRANNAFGIDINVACTGFVSALSLAAKLIETRYQHGLVIGAETLSRLVDWDDRATAVLFGDGAAGVLVGKTDANVGLIGEGFKSYGEQGAALTAGQLKQQTVFNPTDVQTDLSFHMDGRAVYQFATRRVPELILRVLAENDLNVDDVDLFILHQANARIIQSIAHHLDQPLDKFPINVEAYGNTSAASVPILLAELQEEGQLQPGQKIMLAGFGAGLTTGTTLIQI